MAAFMPSPGLQQVQRLGLQQTLSPQMQQSLQILQVPTLELNALIRQELTTNPVLEEIAPEIEGETEEVRDPEKMESEERGEDDSGLDDDIKALAQMDQEWRDYFNQASPAITRNPEAEKQRQAFFESFTRPETLAEHLLLQLHLADAEDGIRALCEIFIGNIDERGFLAASPEEIAAWSGRRPDLAEAALGLLQSFDPIGVGARDLKECLALQLRRLGHAENSAAMRAVVGHLDELAAKKHAEIATALGVSLEETHRAATLISTLDPRPGSHFAEGGNRYITPDLAAQKVGGEWLVLMNDDWLPHLRISNTYKDLLGQSSPDREVKGYVRERIRAAKFLIKSIHQRQQTILRIAQEIVHAQVDFLEKDRDHLKPLTMSEVARRISVHETTVSRAASGKYMQTPHGVFELKYFFTPGIRLADGAMISPDTVKSAISEMVANEPADRPMTDQDLMHALKEKGFPIARRTAAKYREELGILPSHQRRAR